jgi:hypothetical protein
MAGFDYMGYNQKKRAAGAGYASKTAANTYAQFLSQQRGSRKKFDLQQQYEKQAPQVVGSFTKRGLAGPGVQSGIYQKGLTDFATQNFNDMADLNRQQDEEMQQSQFEQAQTKAEYDQQIAELEAQKQASIASAAATLTAFKPFLN